MSRQIFAEVIVDNKSKNTDRIYTYLVPNKYEREVKSGTRVMVPFGNGNKLVEGIIIRLKEKVDIEAKRLKYIKKIIESRPIISESLIKLGMWMKDKYLAQYIEIFRTILPTGVTNKVIMHVKLKPGIDKEILREIKSVKQREIIQFLLINNETTIDTLKKQLNIANVTNSINALVKKEIIELYNTVQSDVSKKYEKIVVRGFYPENLDNILKELPINAIRQKEILEYLKDFEIIELKKLMSATQCSLSTVKTLKNKGYIRITEREVKRNPIENYSVKNNRVTLTEKQRKCINNILHDISNRKNNKFLLHGVTGSGKTEIYLQLIEKMLKKNKQCIVLVPEISLTPQTVERFVSRFGQSVAVLHSRLSLGERYDEWRKIRDGEVQIVVGARSAVFAPFNNLGLIIIDEEHESSYKSSMSPKYDTIEVAEKRCELEGASLVLGSATPSVDTYFRALKGDFRLLELKERINKRSLPPIEIVDMKKELDNGNKSVLSTKLLNAISENLKNKRQTILFLNRRGFSTFVSCRKCGYVAKCKHCDISLTYHITNNILKCHYCGFSLKTPRICPECGSKYIKYFGIGTQKIEELIKNTFPKARVARMDVDTTTRKGSHERILNKVKSGEIDILIGTQMITKGLDFHNVTLVGIIAADLTLNLPDFRAAERTFQLTTQVSGRAGRGDLEGRVILQTYEPDHYSIMTAQKHDYVSFYNQEIKIREEFNYPPFTNIINILMAGKNEKILIEYIQEIGDRFKELFDEQFENMKEIELLGPNPAPLSKIKDKYRWQILIKCKDNKVEKVKKLIVDILDKYSQNNKNKDIKVSLEINPNSIL
jgi:primosomal protein N' (replication factor Y)